MVVQEIVKELNRLPRSEAFVGIFPKQENVGWKRTVYEKMSEGLLLQGTSFSTFRDALTEIRSRETGLAILTAILNRDMAFNVEARPFEVAQGLAERFITHFDESATIYSNSTWTVNEFSPNTEFKLGLSAWTGFTKATFDSGIIIVDKENVGVAWFGDDD